MDAYSISEVAERTGFTPSALRFYEQSGLLRPSRTAAGYRSYSEDDIELLQFVARAKGFGLTLDEITDLRSLLDADRCAPVQDRLRELVDGKLAAVQERMGELVAFAAELRRVADTLRVHTPDGPCDDGCGCTSDQVPAEALELVDGADVGASPPIACSLASDQVADRVQDWRAVVTAAVGRQPIEHGVRVRFPPGTDPAVLAELSAAETGCCQFLRFSITIDRNGVTLDVTGPRDADVIIGALVGAGAAS